MTCNNHHKCEEKAINIAEALCERYGHRFTESRRQIFDALISSHKALTAKELMGMIDNNQPPITYRALEFLTEVGLAHHISSINAYVCCNHAHDKGHISEFLICKDCHEVEEIDFSKQSSIVIKSAEKVEFQPIETNIEILGLCKSCQS